MRKSQAASPFAFDFFAGRGLLASFFGGIPLLYMGDELALRFGQRGADKFAGLQMERGEGGTPLVPAQVLSEHTTRIRTYSSAELPAIPALAERENLYVTAGVWLDAREDLDEGLVLLQDFGDARMRETGSSRS